jgi:hypothetical protein
MHQATDDFSRALDFRRTAGRKRIVAATLDHLASCSFCLNCEEHHVLKMGLLIPFRLKRSYDKMVLEDLRRRRKFTHEVTVRFPSQAAAAALEYVGVGRRLLALIIDGFILLIVGWIIAIAFPSSGVITRGDDPWDRFKWKTFVSSVVISIPLTTAVSRNLEPVIE